MADDKLRLPADARIKARINAAFCDEAQKAQIVALQRGLKAAGAFCREANRYPLRQGRWYMAASQWYLGAIFLKMLLNRRQHPPD